MVLVQCVIGGLLGSSCCLVQLGANLLASLDIVQIGCTGLNKWLGPIRSELRMATGAYLAAYWVWTVTRTQARRKLRQLIFTTAIYLFLTFLPEALVWSGGPALAPPTGDAQLVRLGLYRIYRTLALLCFVWYRCAQTFIYIRNRCMHYFYVAVVFV